MTAFRILLTTVFVMLGLATCSFLRSALIALERDGRGRARVNQGRAAPSFWTSILFLLAASVGIIVIVLVFRKLSAVYYALRNR